MTNILIIAGFLLLAWGTANAVVAINEANKEPEPVAPPQVIYIREPQPEPVKVEPEPQPEPIKAPEPTPEPPKMGRRELEQAARNCLTAAGCKFDVYDYTRYKTDIELMDIIKDYNLNN